MFRKTWLAALLVVVIATTAHAQEKEKKEGSDAVQGVGSPFQIGSGVTFLMTQDKKSLTAGVSGQRPGHRINFWQLGLTGTTNDEGEALVYSTRDTDAPGLKAKIGIGYSSFLNAQTAAFNKQGGELQNEAWCLDILKDLSGRLPSSPKRTDGQRCAAYLASVKTAFASQPPEKEEVVKTVKAVLALLEPIAASVPGDRSEVCKQLATVDKAAAEHCTKIPSIEARRKTYPELHKAMVSATLPTFYYVVTGNYLPTLTSAAYRDTTNGMVDLATKHQWTRMLHGVSIDTALFHGPFAAGIQVGYSETAEIKLAKVCKIATSGEYSAESCKDAMLGKPSPGKAYNVNAAIAIDPLVMPKATSIVRPGAQLEFRFERPTKGDGTKVEIGFPIYLAPVAAPLKLVVGIRPSWDKDTTGDDRDGHFTVSFFIGARPGVGGSK